MSDWQESRISELATIDIGGTPSRAISGFWAEKPSGHPWISIADLKGKYIFDTKEHITALGVRSSNVKLIPKNTTVMSFKLTVGRTAITGGEMFCNEAIAIFQPKDDRLNAKWLYHALPSAATSVVTDTAVKGATLNKAKMAEMTLNLPSPVEQTKIAQILDTLDTTILETEAIIAKLKAVKQGLLHDLLTRGISVNGELRPPQTEAPHLYKESTLGWIPQEWEFAPFVSKIDFPEGQVDPRRTPYRDWVLVAPDHIESGTGRLLSTATAAEQQAISGKYVFQSGDVIYSKIRPYLRKAVLVRSSGLCSADMYPLRPKPEIDPRYLLAVVLGDQFSRFAESVSMRSGFPKINRREMSEFSMGWPRPEEQSWIASILSESDSKQRFEEDELEKLRLLKAGLMDDLLTGRVRVTRLLAEAAQQQRSV